MGLVGQPGSPERGEQPVTGAIAGEDATGSVAAVGRRGQAHDRDSRSWIAEPRQRPPPIHLAGVGRTLGPGHLLSPGHQPGTSPAIDHLALDTLQLIGHLRRTCQRPPSALERPAVLTLVVVAVLAGPNRFPPPAVLPVPVNGPGQPLIELGASLPAQPAQLV